MPRRFQFRFVHPSLVEQVSDPSLPLAVERDHSDPFRITVLPRHMIPRLTHLYHLL